MNNWEDNLYYFKDFTIGILAPTWSEQHSQEISCCNRTFKLNSLESNFPEQLGLIYWFDCRVNAYLIASFPLAVFPAAIPLIVFLNRVELSEVLFEFDLIVTTFATVIYIVGMSTSQ